MEFEKIENGKVFFSEPTKTCRNCSKPMLALYTSLSSGIKYELAKHGIRLEAYEESGVCENCVKAGGFKRECECCHQQKTYPQDFAFACTYHPEYPEGETTYAYICKLCAESNMADVIDSLASSDDTKDLRPR